MKKPKPFDRRQEFRLRIRRQQLDQKQKKRMSENIKKLHDLIQIQSKGGQLIVQESASSLEAKKDAKKEAMIKQYLEKKPEPMFSQFRDMIFKPSSDEESVNAMIIINKLVETKRQMYEVDIIQYLLEFIQKNSYEELFKFKQFRANFTQLLYKVCSFQEVEEEEEENVEKLENQKNQVKKNQNQKEKQEEKQKEKEKEEKEKQGEEQGKQEKKEQLKEQVKGQLKEQVKQLVNEEGKEQMKGQYKKEEKETQRIDQNVVKNQNFKGDNAQLIEKLKSKLLMWCRGTNILNILEKCLVKFLDPREYAHIYMLIEHSLLNLKKEQCGYGIRCLLKLLSNVDYDGSYMIFQIFPAIYTRLIKRAHQFTNPYHELFMKAIIKITKTYEEIVVSMAKMGVLELVIAIFQSQRESYMSGLIILNEFVYIKQEQMGRQLRGKEMSKTWNKVSSLHKSQNVQQVILVYSIFSGFFNSYDQKTIMSILQYIDAKNNIFTVIEKCLKQSIEDNGLVLRGVQIIRTLLYYAKNQGLGLIILQQVTSRGFITILEKIYLSKGGKIQKLSKEILEVVEFLRTQSKQQK